MSKETPLQAVKRLHGSREKLIDSLVKALRRGDEDADEVKERLSSVSNKKLLRLSAIASEIDRRGGVDKAVASLGAALGHAKDQPYLEKLATLSPGDLVDKLKAAERRARTKASRAA